MLKALRCEVSDSMTKVPSLGGKMLLADPLSGLCAPSDDFYDVCLPAKVNVLENLPRQVADCKTMSEFTKKDTAAVARMMQK